MPRIKRKITRLVPARVTGPLWDYLRDGVTQGFLENLVCPERLRLRYELGLELPKFSGALAFGNVVHNALDAGYSMFRDTGDPGAGIGNCGLALELDEARTRRLMQDGTGEGTEEEIEEVYGIASILLRHYWNHWEADDLSGKRKWETLEQTFDVPYTFKNLKDGQVTVRRRGKIDGTYRAVNKRLWMLETKTKSQVNEANLAARLKLDIQVMYYLSALKAINKETPAGVLYNVLRRPQLRRSKKETFGAFCKRVDADIAKRPEWYFVRWEASFPAQDLTNWERGDMDSMLRLAYAWSQKSFHFRNSSACDGKYGTCDYLRYCSGGEDNRLRRREHVYPELVPIEDLYTQADGENL